MSVEIIVSETKTGLEIVSGRRRLDALLALRDEVVVMSPGIGEVVIARLPDGRLQASANPKHIKLFRQPEGRWVGIRAEAKWRPAGDNANAPVAGANSFTEGQAKSKIEGAGFSNVTELKKDDNGVWRGKASKAGTSSSVSVDFQGNVNTAK